MQKTLTDDPALWKTFLFKIRIDCTIEIAILKQSARGGLYNFHRLDMLTSFLFLAV